MVCNNEIRLLSLQVSNAAVCIQLTDVLFLQLATQDTPDTIFSFCYSNERLERQLYVQQIQKNILIIVNWPTNYKHVYKFGYSKMFHFQVSFTFNELDLLS